MAIRYFRYGSNFMAADSRHLEEANRRYKERAPREREWDEWPDVMDIDSLLDAGKVPFSRVDTFYNGDTPKITGLYAHPMTTHTVPTLLGLTFNNFGRQRLGYDYSLSHHSAPLVRRGLAAGLLEPHEDNPTGKVTNSYDLYDNAYNQVTHHGFFSSPQLHPVPESTVADARDSIRTMLRQSKASRNLSRQFSEDRQRPSLPYFNSDVVV